jgi:hypothetical protein
VETTRRIGGHRRVGNRRRGRVAVLATGLAAAVTLSAGSGAEASTPTISYSGLCALGVANVLSPSPESVSVGPGGAVEVVNKATTLLGKARLVVTSGHGQTVELGPGARTVITYPALDSVKTYTLSAKCAAVALSAPSKVTVAAQPERETTGDPAPGASAGSGSGAEGGGMGSSGSGSGSGSTSTGTGGSGTGSNAGSIPDSVPGAKPLSGNGLPPGFANPPVTLSAPRSGNLPIPDVQAAVPGAPGEAGGPDVDLFGVPAVSDADQPKQLAAVRQDAGDSTTRMLLIIVAMVLFLGVGAAALRAVRDGRTPSVAARD